jgi:hypothetical protein
LGGSILFGEAFGQIAVRNWATGPLLFVSGTIGYVMRLDKLKALGHEEVEMSLWRTDHAGRTWKSVGHASLGDSRRAARIRQQKPDRLYQRQRQFFASEDSGQTWKLERSVP